MLALRQNLRLAVRPARTLSAARGYVTRREVAEEIKEDKEGWTENTERGSALVTVTTVARGARGARAQPGSHLSPPNANAQDTESEANVTADNSDAPAKPNERLVEETIEKIDGKHHGGKGELRVSLRGRASSRQAASVDESLDFALGRASDIINCEHFVRARSLGQLRIEIGDRTTAAMPQATTPPPFHSPQTA
ncbi:hypothetical protein A1Q1_05706 [Trichosporon asahii var. asahii CBS 2479]|uniref:Uncharacterized protein n=1 Tax=Trichosporon asahii var. asahii (strain ATCC 90039 / CBS 2479 / JCM 2466 / KCTC 7840 / NBRC 103889/ NCYC 2677 / UAMH 7654) TaxID=1186058 RepID=J5Q6U6_TRIAS|nr:hypothetical protein A1Q1_05706 [Trichosporon asahii var. asahii CBS 2479]EJT45793.1 hypothetical protein A1Q1_05706 [Trichosporon asahii var. asahii CBS 2479]